MTLPHCATLLLLLLMLQLFTVDKLLFLLSVSLSHQFASSGIDVTWFEGLLWPLHWHNFLPFDSSTCKFNCFFHIKSAKKCFLVIFSPRRPKDVYLFTFRQNWEARVRNFQGSSLKLRTLASDHVTLASVRSSAKRLEIADPQKCFVIYEFSVSASCLFI